MEILRRKAFLFPCLIYLVFLVCHNGSMYTLAFFISNRPGGRASQVGLVNTLIFFAGMVAGFVSGKLVEVLRERTVIIIVICIGMPALIFFASIKVDTPLWVIILIMTALSFSQGLKGPAVAKLALSTLPPHRYSTGSGLFSMLRDLGSPAGIGIGLAMFTSQRIFATHTVIDNKAAEMGVDSALLPQIYRAVDAGNMSAVPELATKLTEAGVDFQTLAATAQLEGLSSTLPVIGGLLFATMIVTLLIATRLPKNAAV